MVLIVNKVTHKIISEELLLLCYFTDLKQYFANVIFNVQTLREKKQRTFCGVVLCYFTDCKQYFANFKHVMIVKKKRILSINQEEYDPESDTDNKISFK